MVVYDRRNLPFAPHNQIPIHARLSAAPQKKWHQSELSTLIWFGRLARGAMGGPVPALTSDGAEAGLEAPATKLRLHQGLAHAAEARAPVGNGKEI